ncbi:MAG: single-stranded-DNA-specific exonuclease RecJ, partial [Kiritimatiellales bacterium]|nr:single-stranded-DNA-specific exonuclease RecJ [Kiritimatiellales bacterium]
LKALGARVQPFIPSRLDEGYGLSQDALQRCVEEHDPLVLISVDCGVNSGESVAWAQSKGVDVIVTDHHEPLEETAPALALINPKLARPEQGRGRTFPELENLSGVGVAFKLAHALVKHGRVQAKEPAEQVDLRNYLDIVALGTVADIVPLVHENRIMVRHGLAQLNRTQWVGLQALKQIAGIRGEVDSFHLGFQLGPRINAVGRIGQPMQALRLLITEDAGEARRIAKLLDDTNAERRRIEAEMADEAFAEIDEYFDPATHFGLVVAREGWHPGVVGIVASRVSRHYHRPAIIMGIEADGSARGSCRSIDEYNVLDGLHACAGHLSKHGGHKMAAGLELNPGAVESFRKDFNAAAAESLAGVDLSPVQHIDAIMSADQLDGALYEQLKSLRPFGQDNPEPVWALLGVHVSGSPRVVGKKHLKFKLTADGRRFDAIAFNYALDRLPSGSIDVAFTLTENNWNGNTSLQLQVKDIRPSAQ